MAYFAQDVANEFIQLANDKRQELTPMQVIKLTYLAHAYHLGITDGKPLIAEDVQAWQYGPVIKNLYHQLKQYGNGAVTNKIIGFTGEPIDEGAKLLIQKVYEAYGKFSGPQLSDLTHQPDTPWSKTLNEFGLGAVIDQDLIKDHFKPKIKYKAAQ